MLRQLPLFIGALLLLPGGRSLAAAPAQVIDSTMERVVVYSSSARVERAIRLRAPAGQSEATVVLLPTAVLPDTIQARCKSSTIARVVVGPGQRRLPSQLKAEALIKKLEGQLDALGRLQDEQQALRYELELLERLTPKAPKKESKEARRPAGLFVDAWRRVLSWVDRRDSDLRQKLLQNSEQQQLAREGLLPLQLEAQRLDLTRANALVPSVTVTLQGPAGEHRLLLSYMVQNAGWQPAYELGYDAKGQRVLATYYASVLQKTGEDWEGARLQFSTGMPITLLAVPELPTWTIGRKRDFSPTPRRQHEPAARQWQPPAAQPAADPATTYLQQLLALSERASGQAARNTVRRPGGTRTVNRQQDELDELLESAVTGADAELTMPPPAQPPRSPRDTHAAPSMAPAPVVADEAASARRSMRFSGDTVQGSRLTDVGYVPPAVPPGSPAAAAQGYTFVLKAPGRHSVPAADARRVPLLRERFAVRPRYQIRPGLSDAAYLVAEVKNTTGRPILRGPANLFAGRMFSGQTQLETALPGKTIVLPLGVDDAIKVARHQEQKTASEGLVFKDEATAYTVTVELANHHSYPVTVEVEDQVPVVLRGAKEVEIRGYASASFGKPDKEGKVSWKGKLGAKAVKRLVFSYEIVRPKGKELRQHD